MSMCDPKVSIIVLAVCGDYLVPQALSSHVSPLHLLSVTAVLSLTSLKIFASSIPPWGCTSLSLSDGLLHLY